MLETIIFIIATLIIVYLFFGGFVALLINQVEGTKPEPVDYLRIVFTWPKFMTKKIWIRAREKF